jgi:predicted dehydrogenase
MTDAPPTRWGILGAAAIADRAVGPAIRAARGADLVAVAARDADRARAFADRHGIEKRYAGYDKLLADPDIDAVYVALPNDAHLPWTVAALSAGKGVLCEKPLGLSAEQVETIETASVECGRPVVEASMYRWHPRIRLVQQLLHDGAIGRVTHVAAGFTFGGVAAGNYRLDPAMGGGAAYDVGCYVISAALWAFGSKVESVSATTALTESGVDHTMDAIVDFANGSAELHASIAEPERQWLSITGDAGRIDVPSPPFTAWHGMHTTVEVSDGRETRRLPVDPDDPYRLMVEDVSHAFATDQPALLPLAESLASAAVLDAVFASAGAGRPISV